VVARVRIPLGAFAAEDPVALLATMMIFGRFAFRFGRWRPSAAKLRSARDVLFGLVLEDLPQFRLGALPLASALLVGVARPHAAEYHEAHHRDERRHRQENAYRQSRVGGEQQVDHDATEDEYNRQRDTELEASDMAEHELNEGATWAVFLSVGGAAADA
jgi:hypothetical protein